MSVEPKPVSQFLVYGLVDPRNGELRYVGKSAIGVRRPGLHRTARGRIGETHRAAWLRCLWADNGRLPCILILQECESEVQALAHEVRLIALFREAGFDLTNLTDGGEGSSGYKATPETRMKTSLRFRGRTLSPEHREKIAASKRGKPRSPETRVKLAAAARGKVPSDETRAKMAEANRGKVRTPETCARISSVKRNQSPETRAKISAALKERSLSPEGRAQLAAARAARWQRTREAQATPDTVKQETTT